MLSDSGDRLPWPEERWPWEGLRWRCAIAAAVRAFPPGRPFTVRDVQRALPPILRAAFSDSRIASALGRLWQEGVVVKVRPRFWAVPAQPDFSPREWRVFLEGAHERGEDGRPGHQEALSAAFLARLWERRIRAAESLEALEAVRREIRACEPGEAGRARLRPLYRERKAVLERGGGPPNPEESHAPGA